MQRDSQQSRTRGGLSGTGEFLKAQAPQNAWVYPKNGGVQGQSLWDHAGACGLFSRSTQGCHDFMFQKESRKNWDWGKAKITSQGHPWLQRELEASLGLHSWMPINQGAICGM